MHFRKKFYIYNNNNNISDNINKNNMILDKVTREFCVCLKKL